MKKLKKLFLVIGIIAVLSVMFVVSVSAESLVFYDDGKFDPASFSLYSFTMTSDYINNAIQQEGFGVTLVDSGQLCIYNVEAFQAHVTYNIQFVEGSSDYEKWIYFCGNYRTIIGMEESADSIYAYDFFIEHSSECSEEAFNYFMSYKEITEDDLETHYNSGYIAGQKSKESTITSLEGQVTELNTTITEKDAVITEKDTAISTLEGENEELANEILSLENDVEGLETQASSLSTEVIKLNATVKSLENQMQLKVNKAYAEGLVDSEGDLTTSGIISVFIVILTIGEVVALVMFFVSKAKKRKHR